MLVKSRALFLSALFLASFFTKAIFVIGIDTPQYSDFALLLDTTYEIAEGSRGYLQLPYFKTWSYQTAFPAFMSILGKLFGGNITALLFANCMFAAGTNALVYCISRLRTGEKAARAAAVLYLAFPYVLGLSSVYTNQHLAAFLSYLGVYVIFRYSGSRLCAADRRFASGTGQLRQAGRGLVCRVCCGYIITERTRNEGTGVHGPKLTAPL